MFLFVVYSSRPVHARFSASSVRVPRVFDCFMYNDESLILLTRLMTLSPHVTRFVLGFGNMTFSNRHPRAISFAPFAAEISRFSSQLTIAVLPVVESGAWIRENSLRNRLVDVLRQFGPSANDLILVCDLDEIPKPSVVVFLRSNPPSREIHLRARFFYYSLRYLVPEEWIKPFAIRYGSINRDLTSIRLDSGGPVLPGTSVVHCSYCYGSLAEIIRKLETFPHLEYSAGVFVDPDRIYSRIACGWSMFTGPLQLVDYDPSEIIWPQQADHLAWRMPLKDLAKFPLDRNKILRFSKCGSPPMNFVNGTLQAFQ
jgi:beta-1,4-mannosyl-glycoprotein beta-1,4-N-acetylglucosaminyltransferase